jgi:AcrR family transcriptional regulator
MTTVEESGGTASRILAEATRILVEEGYPALSMRKLGALLGLSQAAIYRHYRDKAELVGAVVSQGYAGLLRLVEGLEADQGPPEEVLARSIRAYIAFATANASLFKAVLLQDIGIARASVDTLAQGVSRSRRTLGALAAFLQRGMESGAFLRADPELSAQAVWAAMFGLAARAAIEADKEGGLRPELVERQIEILLRGLRA